MTVKVELRQSKYLREHKDLSKCFQRWILLYRLICLQILILCILLRPTYRCLCNHIKIIKGNDEIIQITRGFKADNYPHGDIRYTCNGVEILRFNVSERSKKRNDYSGNEMEGIEHRKPCIGK